jgi:Na+/melibiose symporter-like transporter
MHMHLPTHHIHIHHLHIQRWVVWWFYVGLVCGVVAMVNVFTRDMTRSQDHLILLVGIIFWVLGGVVSWAAEGIEHHETLPVERPAEPAKRG